MGGDVTPVCTKCDIPMHIDVARLAWVCYRCGKIISKFEEEQNKVKGKK